LAVIIRVAGFTASVEDGEWRSESLPLQRAAGSLTESLWLRPGYRQDDPDLHAAEEVARVLGGEVTGRTTPPPESVPGRVY
jgi:hypothetical protein